MRKLFIATGLCIGLAGCGHGSLSANDAVSLVATGIGVAAIAAGGSYSPASSYRSPAYTASPSSAGGYSQRGAFEECQRMYMAAGAPHLARECARRASNLGSLN
jgi:hypothetical protein